MNIFVGNMTRELKKENLDNIFKEYGFVESITILIDRINGEWKAFGFVEMPDEKEANKAIESLNGKEYFGHPLTVHQARFHSEDRRIAVRFGGRRHTDLPEIKR